MAKFILRVDDCGWKPDKKPDVGLAYFQEWRAATGLDGEPVVYGFIPAMLGQADEVLLTKLLKGGEEYAVHGWDHADGAVVAEPLMRSAAFSLMQRGEPVRCYIPPFNRYNEADVEAWGNAVANALDMNGRSNAALRQRAERKWPTVFFGGYQDPVSCWYGPRPHWLRLNRCGDLEGHVDVLHLPACRELYAHGPDLLEQAPKYVGFENYPLVVTLHCTWDWKQLHVLRPLIDILRPHLISVDEAAKRQETQS